MKEHGAFMIQRREKGQMNEQQSGDKDVVLEDTYARESFACELIEVTLV